MTTNAMTTNAMTTNAMTTNATISRPRPHGSRRASPELQPRRRRRLPLVAVLVLLVVLAAGLGWLVGLSPVLATREVHVTGVRALSVEQVRSAAQVPLGLPLARVNTQAVADRVAALAPVRSVHVSRSWPRSVRIAVTERTAVLEVRQPNGYALVDDQGVDYLSVPTAAAGVLTAEVDPANSGLLSRVAVVALALPPELRTRVRSVAATSPDGIRLQLRTGARVLWGSADQSAVKAQVLLALLRQKASSYDVSAPQSPALH